MLRVLPWANPWASCLFLLAILGLSACDSLKEEAPTRAPAEVLSNHVAKKVIQLEAATAQGLTGKDVKLAIIDTGLAALGAKLDESRVERKALIKEQGAISIVEGISADRFGHGTAVASLIVGAGGTGGLTGMASGSDLLAIKADANTGSFTSERLAIATDLAVAQKADIINFSLAGKNPAALGFVQALQRAVDEGTLIVAASGNSAQDSAEHPAALAGFIKGKGRILAVGAVDKDNKLASFSNKAGANKNDFLVAPGVNITTLNTAGEKQVQSGTSFSAPIVSSAAALVKEAAPHLTGHQLGEILLQSATDLGKKGVDEVYGHGLLNLNKALRPIGENHIPSTDHTDDQSTPAAVLAETQVTMAPAFADVAKRSQALKTVLGLDAFERGYNYDLSKIVQRQQRANMPNLQSWLRGKPGSSFENLGLTPIDEASTGLSFAGVGISGLQKGQVPDKWRKLQLSGQKADSKFSFDLKGHYLGFVARVDATSQIFASAGVPLAAHMGLAARGADVANQAYANPFLALNGQALAASYHQSLNKKLSYRVGFGKSQQGQSLGATFEYRPSADLHLSFTSGMVREDKQILGSQGQGAFSFDPTASTLFASASVSYEAKPGFTFFGRYSFGQTKEQKQNFGLVRKIKDVRSEDFALGLKISDFSRQLGLQGHLPGLWDPNVKDSFSLSISQPLRIRSGSMHLNVPVARDAEGKIQRVQEQVGLTPSGRQLDFDMQYNLSKPNDLGGTDSLEFKAGVSHQPGHNAEADTETHIGFKFRREF